MRYVATLHGTEHEIDVEELAADSYAIRFGEQRFEADLRKVGPASFSVIVGHRSFDFDVVRDGDDLIVASGNSAARVTLVDAARRALRAGSRRREVSGRAEIRAAMPGRVVDVLVAPGDEVAADQGVLIVEAMKMENELKSPKAGKVIEVKIVAGQTVEKNELLLVIE
ncbi:MAG TPA: biotin/lipoyl-containing protein [Candidatus Binataceae bacterium]|nr:biotin/lipoyl-containing protein [Candidatus Binataceae bacterium]